jgi:hypothetical protein
MRYLVFFVFFFSACSYQVDLQNAFSVQSSVDRKQKQKVVFLQKKLIAAEREFLREQEEVEALRSALCDAQLSLIESELERLEDRWRSNPAQLTCALFCDAPTLLFEEREQLYRIIQAGPDVPRAQNLLDRILQMITQVSDSEFICERSVY